MSDTRTPVQIAADNIVAWHDGLTEITGNIQNIRDLSGDVVDDLSLVRRALDKIDSIKGQVSDFGDDVDKLQLVVKLMGKAGPLKPLATTADQMLKRVETVVDKVEARIDQVSRKITDSQINQKLETTIGKIEEADATLAQAQSKVIGQRDSFKGVADIAAKVYVFAEEPILALGTVVSPAAEAVTRINDLHDEIVGRIAAFNRDMPSADFQLLLEMEADFARIFGVLDEIRAPLDVVYSALKPIEPILNVVGLVSKFTVDPVINFLLETLGIDDVINAASDRITAFLPDVNVLDVLLDRIDVAIPQLDGISTNFGQVDDDGDEAVDEDGRPLGDDVARPDGASVTPRIPDPFGIGQWAVDEIEARLVQTATEVRDEATDEVAGYVRARIGTLDAQGLAVFVEIPEPLQGSDDDDDLTAEIGGVPIANVILVGDDEDNVLTAIAGANMLYGAGGDDTLIGGGNDTAPGATAPVLTDPDTAVFTGPLGQYVFDWADLDNAYSDLTITHVSPLQGVSFDGTDLLQGIERVSFLGTTVEIDGEDVALTLTMQDLRDRVRTVDTNYAAPTGQQTPAGDPVSYYVFANYIGTAGPGIAILGAEGGDLLRGGRRADTIDGGAGDDTIQFSFGDDSIIGGAGRDLYVVEAGRVADAVVDLAVGQATFQGFGSEPAQQVALAGVENVTATADFTTYLYGDAALTGNVLSGGRLADGLHGRGGRDTLNGAEGDDTLVGGAGRDTLSGGVGNDQLIATDNALLWSELAPTLATASAAADPVLGDEQNATIGGGAGGDDLGGGGTDTLPGGDDDGPGPVLPIESDLGELIDGGSGIDTVYYTTELGTDGPNPYGYYRGPTWHAPFGPTLWSGDTTARTEMQRSITSTGWIETRWSPETDDAPGQVEVLRMVPSPLGFGFGEGVQVGVDTLRSVERIVGTNEGDVLRGLPGEAGLVDLFGAGGDDTLHVEGASGTISGDRGRDLVIASARLLPQGSGDATPPLPAPRLMIGDEDDTLDLGQVDGVRWSLWREVDASFLGTDFMQPIDLRDGSDLGRGAALSNYAVDTFRGFGTLQLGSEDDLVRFDAKGSDGRDLLTYVEYVQTLRAGAGDDDIVMNGVFGGFDGVPEIFGEAGNDRIEVLLDAVADGGAGNDYLFGRSGAVTLRGGAGDDTIGLDESFGSFVDGGDGVDLLVLAGLGDVYLDMVEGTVDWAGSFADVANFEAVAGASGSDRLNGSENDDKFAGAGNDDRLWGSDLDIRVGGGLPFEVPNLGQYLQVAGDHETALGGDWSLEVRFATRADTPGFQRIVTALSEVGNQRFSLALKDGNLHLRGDLVGGGVAVIEGEFVADGKDHHVVARYQGGVLSLWLDGELVGSTTPPSALFPADGPITIGAYNPEFRQYLDAQIEALRIWDTGIDPDAATLPVPYLSLLPDGEDSDILAPGADIAQTGLLATPYTVEGETSGKDALYGGEGKDTLSGADDDDFLHPGGSRPSGSFTVVDEINGGRGRDTASFAFSGLSESLRAEVDRGVIREAFEGVVVDLQAGTQIGITSRELQTELVSIENVIGTHNTDLLSGDEMDNVLNGGEGSDVIFGRGGDDVIAALGGDAIRAGDGDDTIGVGLANARIDGEAGHDVVVFDGNDSLEAEDGSILQLNSFTYDLEAGTYTGLVSYDVPVWAEVYAGGTQTEARGPDALTPLMVWRADPEEARSLADIEREVPDYDRSADREDGGLNPTDFRITFIRDVQAVAGELTSIETVRGASGTGGRGDDDQIGSIFDDTISGADGFDTIQGLEGDDLLFGDDHNDELHGGAGDDTLVGGEDADTLDGGGIAP